MNKLIQSLAITGALAVSSVASADVVNWFDDFEAYGIADVAAFGTQTAPNAPLADAIYLVFGNVSGAVNYGYGPFTAPNNSAGSPDAWAAIVNGEGDAPQGAQQLSVFADYANLDLPTNTLESNFYKEWTVGSGNIGETWKLSFEAKLGNLLNPPTTATAFIKVLCSQDIVLCGGDGAPGGAGPDFSVLGIDSVDMTTAPGTWNGTTLSLTIDPAWDGMLLQIGFNNTTTGGTAGSGVFYDNVCLYTEASCPGTVGGGGITAWTDDFEAYGIADVAAFGTQTAPNPPLADAIYLVFGNVSGAVNYGYGPFTAPNNSAGSPDAWAAIVTGEGDAPQGAQQLSVFADYANLDLPTNTLESNFYKEWTVGSGNIGETWTFAFDAKLGNLLNPPTTATAFIKVLCSQDIVLCGGDGAPGGAGPDFSVLGIDSVDMTTAPSTWNGTTLSLTIDPTWDGMLFQIGFNNTTSGGTAGSGVFYDNLSLSLGGIDTDGDGVDDSTDNCTNFSNAEQVDSDGDGHGNACDGDFQNNCLTNIFDLFAFKAAFGSSDPADAQYDMNSTGGPTAVNIFDLFRFKAVFGTPPGPSAPGALCP